MLGSGTTAGQGLRRYRMKNEFYAHSRDGKPREEWHRLEDHLKEVAKIARPFRRSRLGLPGGLWRNREAVQYKERTPR